jgi:hypothetical protein
VIFFKRSSDRDLLQKIIAKLDESREEPERVARIGAKAQRWAAGIAAVSALVGALIGGFISYRLTEAQLTHADERAAAAERKHVRGVARVMRQDYNVALNELCRLGFTGQFSPRPVRLLTTATQRDRQSVAAYLPSELWRTVASADAMLTTFEALQRDPSLREARIDVRDWGVEVAVRRAAHALKALDVAAQMTSSDPLPDFCSPDTWRRPARGAAPP